MEPAPPPITIVDPNAPGGTADVLHSGRDPWRPTRRQAVVGSVVVLVVALVAGVTALVRHTRHERTLDAAAAKAVAFFVDTEAPGSEDLTEKALGLINEGPATVRVLDVAFVGAGYGTQHVDADLPSYQTLNVRVPLGTTCPLSLLDSAATQVRVHARTKRGTVVTRTVGLDPRGLEELAAMERNRCELLRVEEAVGTGGGGSAQLRGDRLELSIVLVNVGRLPVTVGALSTAAGLHAQVSGLPLRLPGRVGTGPTPTRTLHLVLTVTSCDRIRAQLFGNPTFLPDGTVLGPSTLALTATNPYRKGTVMIEADVNDFQPFQDELPQSHVNQLIARRCPDLPQLGPLS